MLSKTFSTYGSVFGNVPRHADSTGGSRSAERRQCSCKGSVKPAIWAAWHPRRSSTSRVQLQMQNKAAFDKAVDALYDPASPTFHKWLTEEDLAKYAPAKEQSDAVRKELESHGLEILSADGFSIRARGTAASVESAFNTQLHEFQRNGKVFRANVVNARLSGAAGDYVAGVAGLESHQAQPNLRRAINVVTESTSANDSSEQGAGVRRAGFHHHR